MPVAEQIQTILVQDRPVCVEHRIMLYAVDWQTYEKFLEAVGNRRLRLTYDRETLEIMTLSGIHEWWRVRFGFVVRLLGAALRINVQGYGSTTLRRQDRERGLEPDECFYIGGTTQMRGPRDIDLTRAPSPNLAIEIDISRSSLDRLSVYAALGIQEVWRFDGETLPVYCLGASGEYEPSERSLNFPSLPLQEFMQFLQQTRDLFESQLVAAIPAWVQPHVLPGPPESGNGA